MSDIQLSLFQQAQPPLAGPPLSAVVPDLPSRVPEEGVECVAVLQGRTLSFRLRRSDRARRLRIVVERPATLTVVLPRRVPLSEVPPALEEHAPWILRTLERNRARARPPRQRIADGAEIQFLGRRLTVREVPAARLDEPARAWLEGDELRARVPPLHPEGPREAVRAWLRGEARREIPRRVRDLGAAHGFRVGRVSVRDQRTKWGACSAAGNLSFNWRLALAPPEVLDYVIVHELCHLRELNHSPRFWELVRSLRPGLARERRWLRENAEVLEI